MLLALVPAQLDEGAVMETELTKSRPTLLVLDLEPLELERSQARIITQLVVDAYTKSERFAVITQQDIQQVIEVEAEKQVIGCGDNSCLAEIAGALDARFITYGTVGKLGDETVVQLNLFDAVKSEAVERHTVKTEDLSDLSEQFDEVIAGMAPEVPAPPQVDGTLFGLGVGLVGAGAIGVVVGAAGGAMVDGALGDPSSDATSKSVALQAAPWLWGVGIGGAVAAAAGGVLLVLSLPDEAAE
jgi:hypothetical protein